jgi:hypothetical protein
LLSNILLTPFGKEMRQKGYRLTRWADDWVVTCRTRAEAEHALARAGRVLETLGVTLMRAILLASAMAAMVYPIIKVQRHRYRYRAAKALNKRGITTGQGGRWHPQTVKRVIEAEGLIKGLPSSGTTGRLIVLSNLGSPYS